MDNHNFKSGEYAKWLGGFDSRMTKGKSYKINSVNGGYLRVTMDNGDEDGWYHTNFAPGGPVRTETVTKRRIVPGVYGRLYVSGNRDPGKVRVGLTETDNRAPLVFALNADELDSLAMVASQLAEALRDGMD